MCEIREASRKDKRSLVKLGISVNNPLLLQKTKVLRSIIEILWRKPEGLPAREVIASIPRPASAWDEEPEVEDEAGYEMTLRLITIPITKVGWMVKTSKGHWSLTEAGRQACKKFSNAQELYEEALRKLDEEQQNISEAIVALERAEELAWRQVEKYLHGKKPFEVKTMMAHLLRACGYHVAWVAPKTENANQPDIVAWTDPIGAKKPRILVQVIHKGQAMTTEGIRSFFSQLEQDDFGLVFSTGGLTSEARGIVKSVSANMFVMDLEAFFDLWVMQYDKLDGDARKLLPLKPIHFLSP